MARKGPKTFRGQFRRAITGDGRKSLSTALDVELGFSKKKKGKESQKKSRKMHAYYQNENGKLIHDCNSTRKTERTVIQMIKIFTENGDLLYQAEDCVIIKKLLPNLTHEFYKLELKYTGE